MNLNFFVLIYTFLECIYIKALYFRLDKDEEKCFVEELNKESVLLIKLL